MQFSIVNYKDIILLSTDFRLDADYFKPAFLKEDKFRNRRKNILITDFCYVTDGQHGYHEVDKDSDIFLITAKNAKGWFANLEDAVKIAKWVDDNNKRSSLKENDLILSTRGTVGLCALVTNDCLPANIDQDVARICLQETNFIKPEFLLTYLNCKFGQDWLLRNASGMVQQGLSLDKVRSIPIPLLSVEYQSNIVKCVKDSYKSLVESKKSILISQSLLLSELGLEGWKPKHRLFFEKNYSDTTTAGRLDAEYFQPKYEEIISAIKKYHGGCDKLGNLMTIKDKNFSPEDKKKYQYIELANISGNGEICACMVEEGRNLPSRARRKVSSSDLIVSSIEGSLSSIALVTDEYDQALCSTGFHVLNSKFLNSETLLVFLKSEIGQMQLKKGCSGTILTAISQDELASIILPKVSSEIQIQIRDKVSESFELRRRSRKLLDAAKRAVEIAIEQDESAAIEWLEKENQYSFD